MDVEVIVSLLGEDRKGLIPYLEQHTHQHHGVWLASKFTQLDGQFAALIKISVPEQQLHALKTFFTDQTEMTARFGQPHQPPQTSGRSLTLKLEARDRLGLINSITEQLDSLGIEIKQMTCRRISVIEIGGNLLSININLILPNELSEAELSNKLEAVSEHIVVHISS